MKYITTINEREYAIEILDDHHITLDGVAGQVDFTQVGGQSVFLLVLDGQSFEGLVYAEEDEWQVLLRGESYTARVEDEREKRLRGGINSHPTVAGEFHLKAPMPGLVVAVPVSEGQLVEAGDVLVILESMKMQNELRSPRPGKVTRLRVAPGERVEQKQTLLSVV